ncbi:MAG: hypothetical protein JW904_14515 [Spirochaetales bacterium]|nr:hypothetical protein [Spirochaetales bacterium]
MSVQFMIDDKGRKTGVVLPIDEYEELIERAEDAEALSMLKKMRKKPVEARNFDDFVKDNF